MNIEQKLFEDAKALIKKDIQKDGEVQQQCTQKMVKHTLQLPQKS